MAGNGKKLAVTISFSREDIVTLEELIVRLKSTRTSVVSVAINLMYRLMIMNCNSDEKPLEGYEDLVIPACKVNPYPILDEGQRSLINSTSWPDGWLHKYRQWGEAPKKTKAGWPKGVKRKQEKSEDSQVDE